MPVKNKINAISQQLPDIVQCSSFHQAGQFQNGVGRRCRKNFLLSKDQMAKHL